MYKETCIGIAGLITRIGGDVSNLHSSDINKSENLAMMYAKMEFARGVSEFSNGKTNLKEFELSISIALLLASYSICRDLFIYRSRNFPCQDN